jgi:multisubunit Na+/H+ antiporter MnhG subunit
MTWTVVAVVSLLLIVIAVVSLARRAGQLSPLIALAWAALILVVPVLGPVAWLAIGRRTAPRTRRP